jgi:hypothetical protein
LSDEGTMIGKRLSGGCQCGEVRYEGGISDRVHYCHCRMCQRAFGNVFATLVPMAVTSFKWLKGEPHWYQSSHIARRGFCGHCGTPLCFEDAGQTGHSFCVSLGTLDHPEQVPPEIHYGIESQLPWLHINDGLPRERTEDDPRFVALWNRDSK